MRDDLLYYYERELSYVRKLGAEFAQRYPKVASRLQLESSRTEDPHVERLLEGFAFLAARVHLKLDDDFPEVSEALLSLVYPQYIRPTPSMGLVAFTLDPDKGKLTTGHVIPRGTQLNTRPAAGTVCHFRTCFDTTVWPIEVAKARWLPPHGLKPAVRASGAKWALSVELRCLPDIQLAKLEMDVLRLHLHGNAALTAALYEVLDNNRAAVLLRDPDRPDHPPIELPPDAVRPVGFDADQTLLPPSRRSFDGYRLLEEYLSFPEKFLFVDVAGLDRARAAGFGARAELVFLIEPFERDDREPMLEDGISKDTIRLGCTPVVNLFEHTSEPIPLNQRRPEYLVTADSRRRDSVGIFDILRVSAVRPGSPQVLRYEPLYSFRHGSADDGSSSYWHAVRRPRKWRPEEGTDVLIQFVDRSAAMRHPEEDAATARLLCYNGDLPSRLPWGSADGDLTIPGGSPLGPIRTLVNPTRSFEPPLGKAQLWRLISQLSLSFLSLVEGGPDELRELLGIHNVTGSRAAAAQIEGIQNVSSAPVYSLIRTGGTAAFARGRGVEIVFDEEGFAGSGVYLLAAVLERFLGLYSSINSFSVLTARTQQRKEVLRKWPPRTGTKVLL